MEVACLEAGEEGSPQDKSSGNKRKASTQLGPRNSKRQKCPTHPTDQRRRSARLLIRELNALEVADSSPNAVKSEGSTSHPSKSTSPFADLTGSVWKTVQLLGVQESQRVKSSSHTDSSPARKARAGRTCGPTQSLQALAEESVGQQLQNRKRKKSLDSQSLSVSSHLSGQAVEGLRSKPESRTQSREECPEPAAKDSHSPNSSGAEVPTLTHSQVGRKRKGEQPESSCATTDLRIKHRRKGRRKSAEEGSPSRKPSAHKVKKGCSSKGKERRGRLELSQDQSGKQKAIRKSVIKYAMSSPPNKSSQAGPSGLQGEAQADSGSSGAESIDPFMALMNEENRRLQMMLESRGLPPHLLGSLGPRIPHPHMFHKSVSSTNNSRAHQLLEGLRTIGDESTQLQSCIEMGQLLVMGNEDTLSGFPVKETVPALVNLLTMEHNFDMMINSCRALTYMMEALPRSSVVVADTIPVLLEKLRYIHCMDVAEQALSALDILSRKHSKSILQAGGVNSCMLYLDFFSLATQRSALSVAANCCLSVTEDDFPLVADSIPVLSGRLQHQDKKSVESCCLCFSRLVENFSGNPKTLLEIASHRLLPNLQNLLVVSPPVISASMVVTVVRMLSSLCSCCPSLAVQLLQLNIEDTLRYLLVGSNEITLENIEVNNRTPSEVYEIVSLISELMPPLPKDGIFQVDALLSSSRLKGPSMAKWEWQDDNNMWKSYGRVESRIIEAAHMTSEEEVTIDINGRTYVIDFSSMQQVNEETGKNRQIRRTLSSVVSASDEQAKNQEGDKEKKEDARGNALSSDPQLCMQLMQALFAVLYEVFSNMAGSTVKHKCLKALLKMFHCANPAVLTEVLRDVSVSCYITTMLGSQDYRVVVAGMQMAMILIEKLPEVFLVYFQREGVVHAMEALKSIPLKALTTPKKPEEVRPAPPMILPLGQNEGGVPSSANAESPLTPNTAKRRIVDIFRKSRRHLRRSFSRTRSEDELAVGRDPTSMPPLPPFTAMPFQSVMMGIPPTVHSRLLSSLDSRLVGAGDVESSEREKQGNKEKIKEWIQEQASSFLKKWTVESSAISQQHPELNVIKTLQAVADQLDPANLACLNALEELCKIVTNDSYNVSAFELLHCGIPEKLTKVLSEESSHCQTTLSLRLRHFVHLFMGLPEYECDLSSWLPGEQSALALLVQKLHGCINQTEQFLVRVHDLPGRRGSQAMSFFNSHQLKCNLERHPSATDLQQWKGGAVRVDPLATMQAIERYLLMRGVTRPEPEKKPEDMEGSDDSEPDETMLTGIHRIIVPIKHQLELLVGGHVVPPNTTVFQAIRQFGNVGGMEAEDDMLMMSNPYMWSHSHTIQYRLLEPEHSSVRPKRSFSLPSTPLDVPCAPTTRRGAPASAGHAGRNRRVAAAIPARSANSGSYVAPPGPVRRVTRSTSKEAVLRQTRHQHLRQHKVHKEDEGVQIAVSSDTPAAKLSPLFEAIQNSQSHKFGLNDPSLPVMGLLKILWSLNSHWNDLYNGFPGNPILPTSDFVNSKLSAKSFRQLQDPLNVMTGSFPDWLKNLTQHCCFLFPFECRQLLFYLTAFDRDRAIYRLQEQQPDFSPGESSERAVPKLDKKKRCVSRELLLEQAEKIMEELAGSRALLEVQYQDEVGTGLGPTLEFYTLVSRELQRVDLHMWRGDPCPLPGTSQASSSDTVTEFIHSPVGLFPAPLGVGTSFSVLDEVCGRFRFLGRFIAKAIIDSRMLDIPLSEAFYVWMLGREKAFTAQDLQHVDPIVARSYAQLAAVAVRKHQLESDPLLSGKALQHGVEALSLEGGGSVEDLELDFTLPGYPDIELKPHGKDIAVTIHNLDEYLRLVLDWTLETGVSRQMEAFREGFNAVFPISSLQMFYSHEMDMLLCGANHQKWDIKELVENCRPDHGYTHDSQAVQLLFRVLSSYDTSEQRQFIQFVTGSPRLPVGGFKALNPPLTIVRKAVDSGQNPDRFLPSVMTCVNYLKLPDYSSEEVMRDKLSLALQEGKDSFHLS